MKITRSRLLACSLATSALVFLTPGSAHAQFGESQELTDSLPFSEAVDCVDLDGDGDLDLLAVSRADSCDAWYENQGAGVFGDKQILGDEIDYPLALEAGDLDGDGVIDVFGMSQGDGKTRWYRGLGAGAFAPPETLGVLVIVPRFFTSGDMDGDGDIDFFIGTQGGGLRWQENLGGTFGPLSTIGGGNSDVTAGRVGDIDGDGVSDLIYAFLLTNRIVWRKGLGAGAFGAKLEVTDQVNWVYDLQLADMDQDGTLDIVYADLFGLEVAWIKNFGGGTFQKSSILSQVYNAASIEAADVDGDGDLDLITCGRSTTSDPLELFWVPNLGGGAFGTETTITQTFSIDHISAGDLDGDGRMDVASCSYENHLAWFRNLGGGIAFSGIQEVARGAVDIEGAILVDLDQDGDRDVVSSSQFDGKVAWYENLGGGEFDAQVVLALESERPGPVRAGDLDGDGDQDLAWYTLASNKVMWMEQTGPGQWATPVLIDFFVGSPNDIDLVDLDQDGDPEIVIAAEEPSGIYLFGNTGGGTFAAPQVFTGVPRPRAFSSGAMTASGRTDLAVVSLADGSIYWLRNMGLLQFAQAAEIIQNVGGASDITLADINGDLLRDPVWIGTSGVYWSMNLGSGLFDIPQTNNGIPAIGRTVEVVDLDTDGDEDVLVGRDFAYGLHWLENEGGLLLDPKPTGIKGGAIVYTQTGDMDGDGDIDVLCSFQGTTKVEWYAGELLGEVGELYCGPAVSNSTGQPGVVFGSGVPLSLFNFFTLHVNQLPSQTFGIFLASPNQGFVSQVPGSMGNLCLGASIGRFDQPGQILLTSDAGTGSRMIDLEAIAGPNGTVAVQPGETWNFQLWYRDVNPNPTSNFTNGLSVLFL